MKDIPEAANRIVDTLSRIQYPVSATAATTISKYTMALHIISTGQSKQAVCELLVQDTYLVQLSSSIAQRLEDVTRQRIAHISVRKHCRIKKYYHQQYCSNLILAIVFAGKLEQSAFH
jgi:hypothetical protein